MNRTDEKSPNETMFTAQITELEHNIELNRYDDTGADYEYAFHEQLGEIIGEFIDFNLDTGFASIKTGGKGVFWACVSARDVSRANKEGGHFSGDYYLKETAKRVKDTLDEPSRIVVLAPRVFHKFGADFIASGYTPNPLKIGGIEKHLDEQNVQFTVDSDILPAKISSKVLTLDEVVLFYNQYIAHQEDVEKYSPRDLRKIFATQVSQLLTFENEFKKLVDSAYDYSKLLENAKNDYPTNYFNRYMAYQFKGAGLTDVNDFDRLDIKQIIEISFALAYARAFEGEYLEPRLVEILGRRASNGLNSAEISVEKAHELIRKNGKSVDAEQESQSKENLQKQFELQKQFFSSDRAKYFKSLDGSLRDLDYSLPEEIEETHLQSFANIYNELRNHGDLKRLDPDQVLGFEIMLNQILHIRQVNQEQRLVLGDFVRFANDLRKEFLQHYDSLTGINNKIAFQKTLKQWNMEEKDFSLVSIDLGFLKYFNALGARETGNLAIQKTGWALQKVADLIHAQTGYKVEIFRSGGDEFQILIDQNGEAAPKDERIKALLGALSFVINATPGDFDELQNAGLDQNEKIGTIPKSPNAFSLYRPESLTFDIGIADPHEAEKLLKQLIADPEKSQFSDLDSQIILKRLNNQTLDPEERNVYFEIIIDIQKRISDIASENQKTRKRLQFMLELYNQIYSQQGQWDPEITTWQEFDMLLTFSGKALEGKVVEDFKLLHAEFLELDVPLENLSDSQWEQLSTSFFGTDQETIHDRQLQTIAHDFLVKNLIK